MIPIPLATLRAAFLRETVRLRARAFEGGPFSALREGEVIVFGRESMSIVLTREHVERLAKLPDGAGAEAVWRTLVHPLQPYSPPVVDTSGPVSSGTGPGITVEDQ